MHDDDRKLVRRMLAGEQRAFDTFFEAYAERLAAFAARRSNLTPEGIEDIVQSSLIKALRNLRSFRGEAALFTWLCEICRHELANVLRSASRQPAQESLEELATRSETVLALRAPSEYEPPHELDLAAHRSAVAATLNRLPERYARVLEWKYGDGFSVQEIARMLGMTTTAAQSVLARAREAFKADWTEEEVPQ